MKPSKSANNVNQAPRYDLGVNPPYQINYRAKRAGKRISASKRRITFQFGFSSASAIAAGRTEVECRGEEHEIVLVWSHMTGKRQLFMDGREIHMSKAARGNTKFSYSWSIPGNHMCKIIANGTPSSSNEQGMGIRQFDFELDGMSFFEFSRIYELGRGSGASKSQNYSYRGMAYDARDDEEEEEENQRPPKQEVKVTSVDLFDSQPSPLSPASTNYNSVPSLIGSSLSTTSSSSFDVCSDEFTPVETRKTFEQISSNIMSTYSTSSPAAPSAASQQSSSRALVPVSEEGMDAITKSMKNLVNLDDINSQPLAPITPNTPSLSNMKNGQANWGLVGRAPTLEEIHSSTSKSPGSQRDVMNFYQQPQAHGYQHRAPNMNMGYAAY